MLARLFNVKLVREEDSLLVLWSFSGTSGFVGDISVGDGLSFGGGTGGSSSSSSVGCRCGLRGSNWWRICCSEASRECFGDAAVDRAFDLGGEDGGEKVSWLSGSGAIVEGSVVGKSCLACGRGRGAGGREGRARTGPGSLDRSRDLFVTRGASGIGIDDIRGHTTRAMRSSGLPTQ